MRPPPELQTVTQIVLVSQEELESQAVFEITDIEHDELTYHPELDLVEDPEDQPRELTIRKS